METEKNTEKQDLKTALVTIVGRPSSGKSTFLNTVCGQPVSIVSEIPQTTRDAIRGIVNTSYGQLVFIDTPGYHDSDKKLNLKLRSVTENQLKDADAILYILDSTRLPGDEEQLTANLIKPHANRTVVAINKIDSRSAQINSAAEFIAKVLPEIPKGRIIMISAKTDKNINEVLKALYDLAPVAPQMYPEEYYTDQEPGFRIGEVIRGEAINRLEQEIPHCLYVDITDMEMKNEGKLLWVRAFLCVERESQKGIVIGKSASMIKAIRIESLKKLRKIFDYKIDLDLQVKVDKNWRQKDTVLTRLIK
ncbi:MAG: GTPase Era [Treponema sp.]